MDTVSWPRLCFVYILSCSMKSVSSWTWFTGASLVCGLCPQWNGMRGRRSGLKLNTGSRVPVVLYDQCDGGVSCPSVWVCVCVCVCVCACVCDYPFSAVLWKRWRSTWQMCWRTAETKSKRTCWPMEVIMSPNEPFLRSYFQGCAYSVDVL